MPVPGGETVKGPFGPGTLALIPPPDTVQDAAFGALQLSAVMPPVVTVDGVALNVGVDNACTTVTVAWAAVL